MTVSASEAVRGNAGILLKLDLDQEGVGPAVEFAGDVKAVDLTPEDRDDSDVTFAEAAAGDVAVTTMNVTAIQSTKAGSLWRFCWDNAGAEVGVTYAPHGNTTPTADKPHFLSVVKLGNRPKIGGEARRAKDRYDFEAAWEVLDGPTLDDGA